MNVYDQVGYISHPHPYTHPSNLAVLARLHGLDPPPLERARVLDIGTNEGGNLIPLSIVLPEAELVGIDLAATPIERGQAVVDALGLKRVRLLQMNLLDLDESFGTFDYIIAHGVYAWTPPEVRDRLLAVARANLSPRGVAVISYNTYPGGHIRKLLRELMLLNADRFEAPQDRLSAARAMLTVAAAGWPHPNPVQQAIAAEARDELESTDSSLYHDILAPGFEPVYFRDFVEHAARHGLAYVADGNVGDTYILKTSREALDAVRAAAPAGEVFQEQFLDFLRFRWFRQSLLCHGEQKPVSRWNPARAAGLHASAEGASAPETEEAAPALLRELRSLWPGSRPLEPDEAELALQLYRGRAIELNIFPNPAVRAGERPRASPLIRFQAAHGDPSVTTLRHRPLNVVDDRVRRLLTLLDGSLDREELAAAMNCSRAEIDAQLQVLEGHAVFLG